MPQAGDKVQGQVVSIGANTVFVELNGFAGKAEATLDLDQVTNADGEVMVALGDAVEARVVEVRGATLVLRTSMGRGPDARAELAQAHAHKLPVEGVVTAAIKGGVEVLIAGMRGFCPVSQLDTRYVEDPAAFVGEKLSFRIIRYETERRNPNIVLSRRSLLEEEAQAKAAELRTRLHAGAVLKGTVTTLKPYGCFVDLGGLEGMIHVSELGFGRVDNPADVVHEGQEVEVQVLKIEPPSGKKPERIALSLKALAADPWDEVGERLSVGGAVTGTIRRLQSYGAFVELMPGVEGLLHISQLGAGRRLNHPSEVVRVGEEIEVNVLDIDRAQRRISLSRVKPENEAEASPAEVAAYQPQPSGKSGGGGLGTFADLLKKR